MERAVVLIGVRRSGDLPVLQAVEHGLEAMLEWARGQGIPDERIAVLSDADDNPVRTADVFKTVAAYVNLHSLEQLVVYFCGHGVNKSGEYWLLSEAPDNPNEAVNVEASVRLAARCHIPHVVLISDACRTAPDRIQAIDVTGSEIFPNRPAGDTQAWVDVFYACRLGDPAFEVADPGTSSSSYHAVYTEVMAEVLDGDHPEVLRSLRIGARTVDVVQPWPLADILTKLVPIRLAELRGTPTVSQVPDSRLTSRETAPSVWLSQVDSHRVRLRQGVEDGSRAPEAIAVPSDPARAAADSAAARLTARVTARFSASGAMRFDHIDAIGPGTHRATADLLIGLPPSAARITAQAALRVHGAQFDRSHAKGVGIQQVATDLLYLDVGVDRAVADVLVSFSTGHCTVVPAFHGKLGTLTVEDGQLVDVSYLPLPGSAGAEACAPLEQEYLPYRARVAADSRYGLQWWMREQIREAPQDLMTRFDSIGALDPSIAVYLAYALADLGRRDLLRQLLRTTDGQQERPLFDVALLAEQPGRPCVPFMPLLSRGWPLLAAEGPDSRALLEVPGRQLSHWTLFADTAFDALRTLLDSEGTS
ncbi:hypothetical protein TR51_00145 [Kitasatospora griseola]|uniref:Uncharacterized protein n=1 Tax=Kitasatospora griseola TaxID=2064 RepID=A0A0D0P3G9_KITGR|nr:hypothetical protein [Kitasatospora griseola]KIQ66156.1 hypothetical protein TR51_00145 [Kitasatospora griseola]